MPQETSSNIALLDANYEQVCAADAECRQLVRHLMQAFGASTSDGKSELMKRFSDTFYPLVVGITHRLGFAAVHTAWLYCAQRVVQSWASKLASIDDSLQLLYLVSSWITFQSAINLIHSLALYAEKAFVERHQCPLYNAVVNDKCCRIFANFLLIPLKSRLTAAILAVMHAQKEEEERENEAVDTVKTVLNLLRYLDGAIDSSAHLYHRLFALPYLASLKRIYRSEPLPASSNCSEILSYLRKCERIIEEENATANKYSLPEETCRMTSKLLYSLLIESQRKTICAYTVFEELMTAENEKQSALGYFFQMCKFDDVSVKLLTANIERYLSSCLGQLSFLPATGTSLCTREQVLAWVRKLLALYSHWLDGRNGLLSSCFADSEEARQTITATLAGHLNASPTNYCTLLLYVHMTSMVSTAFSISPSCSIDRVLDLLQLIQDKQAISECAWHLLCHRIINHLSPLPDRDVADVAQVFKRLQIESPISGKLILDNFYSSLNQLNKPNFQKRYGQEFQINILNGLWKLDNDPTTQTFRLPRSFWTMYSCFHREFASANRKKNLKLNRNYGYSEMMAHLSSGSYQFILSLRQTVVLLLFNRDDALPFGQIQAKCKLDAASLLQCIELFCKCNLLLKIEEEDSKTFLEESTFVINDQFSPLSLPSNITGCMEKDSTVQVNWINLQQELCCNFDLGKLLTESNGQMEENQKPVPKLQKSPTSVSDGAGSSKEETVVQKPQISSSASMVDSRFRLEAAIIRVLKRSTVVANIETLRDLTLEALALTNWQELAKGSQGISLPLTEMTKCVDSLEKNGYLRQLSSGDIVYEP